jgi:hypothetical protein
MKAKALELRDEGTFIALLAVDMNPILEPGPQYAAQRYLLRRVGYPCDCRPNILITKLAGDGSKATNDPYYWGDRTMANAHRYIIEHWNDLKDGDVVDVQFILGETPAPKASERFTSPL